MTIRTRVRTPTRIDAPSCPTTRDLRTDRKRTVDPACWPASNPCCRSEEHTSELQSLMRISYAVFCLKKKNNQKITNTMKTLLHSQKQIQHTLKSLQFQSLSH